MSWGVSPWVYPVWDSLGFLDLDGYFLPYFRDIFNITFSSIFSWPFFLSSSSGTHDSNAGAFNIVPEVSEVVFISFNSFFFFPLCFIYFHHSIFHLTYLLSSASVILLLILFRVLLISVIAVFIID